MKPIFSPNRLIATAAAALLACTASARESSAGDDSSAPSKLVAVLQPLNGTKVEGTVVFEAAEKGVAVSASIGGLYPGQDHVFAIHRFGDLRGEDAGKTGGRFTTDTDESSDDEDAEKQADGFDELTADNHGDAELKFTAERLSLTDGANAIIGRAVVIHSRKDGDDDSESAGQPIAMAVIGIGLTEKADADD